jgi:hypothetical protein
MSTNFEDLILRDETANRPAAGKPGRLFYDTDLEKWQRDNGSTWDDCEPAAGAATDNDAIHDNVSAEISAITEKTTLHADDLFIIEDSEASNAKKRVKKSNAIPTPGRVLIAEATPSGTGTVSFTSIPGTYKTLEIDYVGRSDLAANNLEHIKLELNADTTVGNYRWVYNQAYGTGTWGGNGTDSNLIAAVTAASAPANSPGVGRIIIPFYALTTFKKGAISQTTLRYDDSAVHESLILYGLEWENTAAITRVDLKLGSGSFVAGSTFRLYGVN